MKSAINRLRIVAVVCFFPLALVGISRQPASLRSAVRLYYLSIWIMLIFLFFLALYTYYEGGNFIKVLGTFY